MISKFCRVFWSPVLFDYKPAGVKEARERYKGLKRRSKTYLTPCNGNRKKDAIVKTNLTPY